MDQVLEDKGSLSRGEDISANNRVSAMRKRTLRTFSVETTAHVVHTNMEQNQDEAGK